MLRATNLSKALDIVLKYNKNLQVYASGNKSFHMLDIVDVISDEDLRRLDDLGFYPDENEIKNSLVSYSM